MSRGCDAENRRWLLALLLAHPPSPYYGPSKKGVGSDFTILNCNNLCSHSVSSESVSVQPVAEPLFAVQSGPGSVYRAAHSHSRGQRQSLRARMVPRPDVRMIPLSVLANYYYEPFFIRVALLERPA